LNTKQAKDFIVEQAAQQAALEGVPLADIEKRMMYFTESDAASCDNPIELNDEFEAKCRTKEYESKISQLLHHAYKRLKQGNPEQLRDWNQAIRTLRKGDHYLLVMVDQSSTSDLGSWTPFFWGIGIGILIVILGIIEEDLDHRGLIPSWVFGWISDKPRTGGLELSLVFLGCVGLWQIAKLAKAGALRDVTKGLLEDILSAFSLRSPKARSRK
jgi:hypothetical protein